MTAFDPVRDGTTSQHSTEDPQVSGAEPADATLLRQVDSTVLRPGTSAPVAPVGRPEATLLRDSAGEPPTFEQALVTPEPGVVVHHWYRLETLLGLGAMGQVWRALDLQRQRAGDPQPYVALKLVGQDFAQHERAMVALQREASKAQQLAHPNIATAYVFGQDPDTGQCYLAMELLEGRPLDRLIHDAAGGLEKVAALRIVRGLAAGLAYAHAKGVVHCDFKPGNAFVTEAGVAKVLDFGIARLAKDVARRGDNFDAGELHALTPAYASLEMLRGDADPHPADDVYALGLVAYETLTGRHPYGHCRADEAAARRMKAAPIKAIARREWRAIERAIRFERKDRWPDAESFLKALSGIGPWIPALSGLAATLALVAGYAVWQNHLDSLPRIPFEQLPVEVQADFTSAMTAGDRAYGAATTVLSGPEALAAVYQDALGQYAMAYELHPKNPRADAALRRALSFVADNAEAAAPEVRTEALNFLTDLRGQTRSLAKYAPLDDAIRQLQD